MATPPPPENTGMPQTFSEFYSRIYAYTAQFPTNLHTAVTSLPLQGYIRLVWIVGAYLLVRPLIEKGFAKWMGHDTARLERERAKQAEEERSIDPATGLPRKFVVKAGDIRSGNAVPVPPDAGASPAAATKAKAKTSSSDAATSTAQKKGSNGGQEWGQGARRRQAKFVEAWEKEQAEKEEEDSDSDSDSKDMDPVLLKGWDY